MDGYAVNWGAVIAFMGIAVAWGVQWIISKRALASTDRHVNFEEANDIIERQNTEIERKDAELTALRSENDLLRVRCRECEIEARKHRW